MRLDNALLYSAITQAPEDNTARRAYADAYAEQTGDEKYNQFIQTQIARAETDAPETKRHLAKVQRSRSARAYRRWLRSEIAPELEPDVRRTLVFKRGFVEGVMLERGIHLDPSFSQRDALSLIKWLGSETPALDLVQEISIPLLFWRAFPELESGETERIHRHMDQFLGNKRLKNLKWLNLTDNTPFDRRPESYIVTLLCHHRDNLSQLERLDLSYNQLTEHAIAPLVRAIEAGAFPHLRKVVITEDPPLANLCNNALRERARKLIAANLAPPAPATHAAREDERRAGTQQKTQEHAI